MGRAAVLEGRKEGRKSPERARERGSEWLRGLESEIAAKRKDGRLTAGLREGERCNGRGRQRSRWRSMSPSLPSKVGKAPLGALPPIEDEEET